MWIEAEHAPADELRGPALDDADVRVTVLDGRRELAGLERRAHPLELAARHLAVEDERLCAAADARVERAHERLVRGRRTQRLGPDLAALRLGDPECARFDCRFGHLTLSPRGARRPRRHTCKPIGSHASVPAMPTRSVDLHPQRSQAWLSYDVGSRALAIVGIALALGAGSLALWLDDNALLIRAAVLSAAGAAVLLWRMVRHFRAPSFGAEKRATLVPAAPAVLLASVLGTAQTPALGWMLVGLGTAAVALDGVDGALARRRGEASAFGARFDMETDALLILVLAALVWQQGKAGPWILAAGLLRYLFVAASWVMPWFGAALPPSRRRQTVCVIQIVSLLGALAPIVVQPWSAALVGAGLAALVWSFAVD